MIGLGAIRPGEWDVPLFLHVFGALALIGTLALTSTFLFAAARDGSTANLRLALRSLTLGVIPAYLVLRSAPNGSPTRRATPTSTSRRPGSASATCAADLGFLLIVISSLLGWFALPPGRVADGEDARQAVEGRRVASILIALLLVAQPRGALGDGY